jgi:hypothetical protein
MSTAVLTRSVTAVAWLSGTILLAAATLHGCGGTHNGERSGPAGDTGTQTGAGGSAGGDGGGGNSCPTKNPGKKTCDSAVALADPVLAHVGGIVKVQYQGSAQGTGAMVATLTCGVLNMSDNVASGDYAGAGISLNTCMDLSAFDGIQFTLTSSLAGCQLYFQVETFAEEPPSNGGGCIADGGMSCYSFPQLALPQTSGTVTVKWTDLMGGMPTTPAEVKAKVLGFQWQFQGQGCDPSMKATATVTDIMFTGGGASPDAATDASGD